MDQNICKARGKAVIHTQKESHLVYLGGLFLTASLLFLIGTIFMRATGGMGLTMNPQYLFNDGIAFSFFGMGLYFIGKRKR